MDLTILKYSLRNPLAICGDRGVREGCVDIGKF
jgi:hypothetical protein